MENTKHPQVHIVIILILIKELIFYKMDLDEKQKQTDCCTLWMQSSATPPASHKKKTCVLLHVPSV